jgi:hypothetical protein
MCIEAFDFRITGWAMRMEIHFDRLNIDGFHETQTMTVGGRPVTGNGPMRIDLFDMYVTAIAQLEVLQPSGNLNVTSLNSQVRVTRANADMRGTF